MYKAIGIRSWPADQDLDEFDRAAASEQWQAMATDAGQLMERFGVTLTSANGEELEQSY